MEGIESQCRNRLPKDNLRIFNEMKIYSEEVLQRMIGLIIGSTILR